MATNLPRRLNPDTGEWEVVPDETPAPATGGGTTIGSGSSGGGQTGGGLPPPLPPPPPAGQGAPLTYNAPQVPGSNTYNPNADFIRGGPDYTNYAANVAASGTQTATTPTTTTPTALPKDLSPDMTDDQVKAWTANYLSTHGGDPSKVDYWLGKWHLWGSKDPNYYLGKLSNDESIPGAQWSIDAAKANTGIAPITPPASLGTGGIAAPSGEDAPGSINYSDTDPFAWLPGGGVRLASGAWVPASHPLAAGAKWGEGTTTSTSSTTTSGPANTSYQAAIQNLLNAGRPTGADAQGGAAGGGGTAADGYQPTAATAQQNINLMNSPENQAFQLAQQRNEERQRAQIAERDAANGTAESGAQEGQFAGLRQARGEQQANFVGQLAITRMQQQREDLVNGIQFAMADQQFTRAEALKKELGYLDASIRQKQMELQASTEGAKLSESGRQYDLGLGFNYTELQQRAQQAAMELLLNGGGSL
jgi:hypothetical protein